MSSQCLRGRGGYLSEKTLLVVVLIFFAAIVAVFGRSAVRSGASAVPTAGASPGNVRPAGLKFFDAGVAAPASGQRQYQYHFDSATARNISIEVSLTHPAPTTRISFRIVCTSAIPGRNENETDTLNTYIDPGWTSSLHTKVIVPIQSARFPSGTYTVSCSADQLPLGSATFEVAPPARVDPASADTEGRAGYASVEGRLAGVWRGTFGRHSDVVLSFAKTAGTVSATMVSDGWRESLRVEARSDNSFVLTGTGATQVGSSASTGYNLDTITLELAIDGALLSGSFRDAVGTSGIVAFTKGGSVTAPDMPEGGFAALVAHVTAVQFFESGKGVPAVGLRSYSNEFSSATTRFVNVQLTLASASPRSRINFRTECTYTDPTGHRVGSAVLDSYVDPGWTSSDHAGGSGFEDPGRWAAGAYAIECRVGDQVLATGQFRIIQSPPELARRDPQPGSPGAVQRRLPDPRYAPDVAARTDRPGASGAQLVLGATARDLFVQEFPLDSVALDGTQGAVMVAVEQALRKNDEHGVARDPSGRLITTELTRHGIIGFAHFDRYVVAVNTPSDASTWMVYRLLTYWDKTISAYRAERVAETNMSFMDKRRRGFVDRVKNALRSGS